MKKRIMIIGIVILIIASIGFLTINKDNNVDKRPKSGKIVIWTSKKYNDYLTKRINKITEENSKVSIELVNKMDDEILQVINGEIEEKPDIVILNSGYMQSINKNNVISTDFILHDYQNNFYNNRLSQCKVEDDISLGIPLTSNPQLLYINKIYLNGFNPEDILTWSDFVSLGNSIKGNLTKDEAFISINTDEYRKFLEILYTQQGIGSKIECKSERSKSIQESTLSFIKELQDNGLLSLNSNKKSVIHFGSNDKYQQLIKTYGNEYIIARDLPTFVLGANGSVSLQGDNYIILSEKKKELIKFVLINLFTNVDELLIDMNNGEYFVSYAKAYKQNEFSTYPYPEMINVEKRSPYVKDREGLEEIISKSIK